MNKLEKLKNMLEEKVDAVKIWKQKVELSPIESKSIYMAWLEEAELEVEVYASVVKDMEDFLKMDAGITELENANGEVFKEGEPDIDEIEETRIEVEEQKELSGLN